MPVVTVNPITVPGQVNQTQIAASTQKNFRQQIGEVLQWNPEANALMVKSWLNNAYRQILDKRLWYGLMVRGQIQVPNVYTTGTATFTLGSATVQGYGTSWTTDMIGRQIRSGFSTGFYNIAAVDASNQKITLDLPWGNPTVTQAGYTIMQVWVTLGYNIKMVLWAVNQRQGYPLAVNVPQKYVNARDTWRTTTGWTRWLVNMPPSAKGEPMYELWPAPTFQQAFPFCAYTQTRDMEEDTDYPAAFVRSDILVKEAVKDALLFRKDSPYYDPTTAAIKHKEFLSDVEDLKMMDDNLYPKDLLWDVQEGAGGGGVWDQMHEEPPH